MFKWEINDIDRKINVWLINFKWRNRLSSDDIKEIIWDDKTDGILHTINSQWYIKESMNNDYYVQFSLSSKEIDIKNVVNKHFYLKKFDDHISTVSSIENKEGKIDEGNLILDASNLNLSDKRKVLQRISIYFIRVVSIENDSKNCYIGLVLWESWRDFGHYFYLINSFLDSKVNDEWRNKILNIELVQDVKVIENLRETDISGIDINLKLIKQEDYFNLYKLLQWEKSSDKDEVDFMTDDSKEKKDVKYKLKYYLEVDKKTWLKTKLVDLVSGILWIIWKWDIAWKWLFKIKNNYKWKDLFSSNLHFPFKVKLKKNSKKVIINNIDDDNYFENVFNSFLYNFQLWTVMANADNIDRTKLKKLVGLVEEYSLSENNEWTSKVDTDI